MYATTTSEKRRYKLKENEKWCGGDSVCKKVKGKEGNIIISKIEEEN